MLRGCIPRRSQNILFPSALYPFHFLIAFQTLFGAPAFSFLAIHAIDISVYFLSFAADSIFIEPPFLSALNFLSCVVQKTIPESARF